MIELMEQQIINNVKKHFLKNENLRRSIDISKTAECFRYICSSRSSTIKLVKDIKEAIEKRDLKSTQNIDHEIRERLGVIFDWVLKESIDKIIEGYENSDTKDLKKKEKYKEETVHVKKEIDRLRFEIIIETEKKIKEFYDIDWRDLVHG